MISVDEALARILAGSARLAPRGHLLPDALGLVLAEPLIAPADLPAFASSAVDGFAVRAAETPGALRIGEEIFAGRMPLGPLSPGQAARIMTGGVVPDGADACVMVERTRASEGQVEILGPASPGQHVRPAGESARRGERLVEAGTALGPAHLGMAATLGRDRLLCHPRPRVAVIATGDELVEPGQPLAPGQIWNSNAYALEAQVRTAGGIPERFAVVRDEPGEVAEALREALTRADLVLTSGGVSMGDHDHVRPAIQALGGELGFWKVAMRPGKPLAFGVAGGVPVIGLPGNPVSSMVGFEVFVRPALARMRGLEATSRSSQSASLAEPVDKPEGLRVFMRCRVDQEEGSWWVRPAGPQGSGILRSMCDADGLAVLPEGRSRLERGAPVEVWRLTPWVP